MRHFRDLIARRRPPSVSSPDPAIPEDGSGQGRAAAPVTRLVDDAVNPALIADLQRARDAATAVPRVPDAPQWSSREWLHELEDRPATRPASAPVDTAPEDGGEAASQPVRAPDDRPAPKVWDLDPGAGPAPLPGVAPATAARPAPAVPDGAAAPAPTATPSARVKTRLLGFGGPAAADAFDTAPARTAETRFPVGWLVVVDGPGRGHSFTLTAGLSTIGRSACQTMPLDFGDASISRENHASIAYDAEDHRVLIGHGGKSNIVRLNDDPLVSTEALSDGDLIRVGKTTLLFVGLCGPEFNWTDAAPDDADG